MEIDRWICHVFIHAYAQTRTCPPWHSQKQTYIYEKRRTKETYVHEEHVYRTVCCRMSVFCSHTHMMECVCCTLSCGVLQGFVVMRTCRNVSPVRCVAVCFSVFQCVALCCTVLHCVALCCTVLHCVSVCCSVLQCVAVCFSCAHRIQECVYRTMCCSVLQCVWVIHTIYKNTSSAPGWPAMCGMFQRVCLSSMQDENNDVCAHTLQEAADTCVLAIFLVCSVCCVQCVLALNLPCLQKSGGIFMFIMQLTPYMNATDFVCGFWLHPWLLQKSGSSKNIIIRNWRRSSKSWEVSNSTHALRVFYKTNLIHLN